MSRRAAFTVDLDGIDCYRTIHGLEPQSGEHPDPAYEIGVTRLMELLDELGVSGTFFVIGEDVERHPRHAEILEEAGARGHELGNHTFSHDYALRSRDAASIEDDIARGEDAIASVWGRTPVGFRTPGYNLDDTILSIVERRGYLYDSSVFPCPPYWAAKAGVMTWLKFAGRPSGSMMTLPETLLAPITSYRPRVPGFWRRGESELWEVPMCLVPGMRFPVIGTSLHLMKAKGFDAIAPLLESTYEVLNLEFHAIDFMDAGDPGVDVLVGKQPDLAVPWEEKRALYAHVVQRLRQTYRFDTLESCVREGLHG